MAKKKAAIKKATRSRKPEVDEADGVKLGEEPVPGMRLRAICRGHQGTIGRIAWSPCGRFIASPSSDKTIRIWDANDGKCLVVLKGHTSDVYASAWSPDGTVLATGGSDEAVRLWSVSKMQLAENTSKPREIREQKSRVQSWQRMMGHAIVDIEWSPNGDKIATAAIDESVGILEPKAAVMLTELYGHSKDVRSVSWSPDGESLASGSDDRTVRIWRIADRYEQETLWHTRGVNSVAWSSDSTTLATGSDNHLIHVFDLTKGAAETLIEGHTGQVLSVAFSADCRLLASKSRDSTFRVWDWSFGLPIAKVIESSSRTYSAGISFARNSAHLATLGEKDTVIRVWELDPEKLVDISRSVEVSASIGANSTGYATLTIKPVHYTSAKIVLVGESNVGKSCLAMRLAEDRYPEDHEHGTTHGMRFWPLEAEELHASAKPPDGQRRDVVLWDFGGQDEYQLVHQMFLHDTTLALVLIDPTRGRAAMDEARDWNKRLEKHLGKPGKNSHAVKLLVGAKVDESRQKKLIDQNSIDALCRECGFAAFLDLSAKTGRNTKRLRKLISDALDWDQMAKTSRPELFQHIRDDIEARRKKHEIVVMLDELTKRICGADVFRLSKLQTFNDQQLSLRTKAQGEIAAVDAVSDQLATQGIIVRTRLTGGDEALVLQLPVIERYAGSLIISARNNSRGVPVLEERLLGSTKTIPLTGMPKKERLSPAKERMVLECIVELMIQHGICFRHGGLLVFPTLFPAGGADDEKLPHSVSLYYDFTGAIDNIYASLVSKLMVSEEFGEGRLKAGHVEFDDPSAGMCGIRQVRYKGGFAHLDLFFGADATKPQRELFTTFVEEHLRSSGVDITEHRAIKCKCGHEVSEELVQKRIARGDRDVICPVCGTLSPTSDAAAEIRERNPEARERIVGLRKRIEQETTDDVALAKGRVAGKKPLDIWREKLAFLLEKEAIASDPGQLFTLKKEIEACRERIDELSLVEMERPASASNDEKIRLLHLSDLHFTGDTSVRSHFIPLLQDIRNGEFLGFDSFEYLVISGDMTDRGRVEGFEKAREFVTRLIDDLGLSSQRCILVPGNHDVRDLKSSYAWQESIDGLSDDQWVKKDDIYLVRDDDQYVKRFKAFSDDFFHKLLPGEPYPLIPSEQGRSYLFPGYGIQFLALNSAWEIDQFHRKRCGIHFDAVLKAIDQAEQQVEKAIENGDLKAKQRILRFAVWHHAATGPEMMQKVDFISNLQQCGVRFCLHGDVHEMRCDLVGYKRANEVQVIGAGSFGSVAEGRPESTPRLYNIFEIEPDLSSVRVHTRARPKPEGAWQGWYEWPDPEGKGKVPYFDVPIA